MLKSVLDLYAIAKLWVMLLSVYGNYYIRSCIRFMSRWYKDASQKKSSKITRVLAFCEDENEAIEDFTDFGDVTHWFDPWSDHWKEDIQTTFPNWKAWKLEIRYLTPLGTKKRLVVRHDEELIWPHPQTEQKPESFVLAAFLCSPEKHTNVMKRLNKYVRTPTNALFVRDIFPMDDHAHNASYYTGLNVFTLGGEVKNYGYNDALVEKKNIQST